METVDRKLYWRRVEVEKVRQQRVIAGYVELKHAEIYKEAVEFYELLNQKYPKKKDLRKTNEFEWLKAGIPEKATKKFYTRRIKCPDKEKVSSKTTNTDNMQLIIPLMKPPVETQLSGETSETNVMIEDAEVVMIEDAEVVIESSADDKTQDNVFDASLGEIIPDNILQDIMSGLREDPDLQTLFDDLDIDIEETSPLERELMQW